MVNTFSSKTVEILKDYLENIVKQLDLKHPNLNGIVLNKYRTGNDYIAFHSDSANVDGLDENSFIVS